MNSASMLEIAGVPIGLAQRRDVQVLVSQSYSGVPLRIAVNVWRAERPGPTVCLTAAVHGDELNGTGIVRELILRPPFSLSSGSLVLIPVVNMFGFERHARYLPDRRDLNRCFPGAPAGSLSRRFAHTIFDEVICKCDVGIDFHTAAVRRTNFPNIRADLDNPQVARIAEAFGCEVIVNSRGPKGSLRRAACETGHPTVILEAGEVCKIEPAVVECGVRGVRNVLIELGMVDGIRSMPVYQARVEKTHWIRAECGGLLQFHVAPGDVVERAQPIATNSDLFGREQNMIRSPDDGIILGMSTMPAATPGDPIVLLALPEGGIQSIRQDLKRTSNESLHERLRADLASSISVSQREPD